jgi:glycosyltransferase involved in cell wall biosynthesis
MTDLFVISLACFREINRAVYRLLAQDGMKVELVVPKTLKVSTGEKPAEPAGAEDPLIHFLKLIGENPRVYQFEGLIALLDKKKPRLVLLDNDPASVLAVRVGKWCRKNNSHLYCISCENLPLDIRSSYVRRGLKGLPASIFKRMLLGKTRGLVQGVFTINRDGEKLFRNEGFRNVVHMPLGFDPVYFHPDQTARDSIRTKYNLTHPVIAYFGRIIPEKGVHILIRALQDLKALSWHLMMDSFDEAASNYHAEVNRLIRKADIIDRTIFIDPTHFEISSYMNAADLIVVPSVTTAGWKEQYGRVAAEALGCGKMVITSDSGALPELLQNHGWLFKEGDPMALQVILRKMLSSPSESNSSRSQNTAAYAFDYLSIQHQKKVLENAFQ